MCCFHTYTRTHVSAELSIPADYFQGDDRAKRDGVGLVCGHERIHGKIGGTVPIEKLLRGEHMAGGVFGARTGRGVFPAGDASVCIDGTGISPKCWRAIDVEAVTAEESVR